MALQAKSIVESKILDWLEMKEPVCPICGIINDGVEKFFDSIFYELVNDPKVRSQLRGGICVKHADHMLDFLSRHPEQGILGVSIIYEDIISFTIEQVKNDNQSHKNCVFCEHEENLEKLYLNGFQSILSLDDGLRIYEKAGSVFCLNHYENLRKLLPLDSSERLKLAQVKKLETLKQQLKTVITKHDYTNKEPMGSEARVYRYVGKLIANLNTAIRRNCNDKFGKIRKKDCR